MLATILAWRFAFNRLIRTRQLVENVLIVGTGPVALALARQIVEQDDFAYRIVGFAADTLARYRRGPAGLPAGAWAGTSEIGELVTRYGVDRIIVGGAPTGAASSRSTS